MKKLKDKHRICTECGKHGCVSNSSWCGKCLHLKQYEYLVRGKSLKNKHKGESKAIRCRSCGKLGANRYNKHCNACLSYKTRRA